MELFGGGTGENRKINNTGAKFTPHSISPYVNSFSFSVFFVVAIHDIFIVWDWDLVLFTSEHFIQCR